MEQLHNIYKCRKSKKKKKKTVEKHPVYLALCLQPFCTHFSQNAKQGKESEELSEKFRHAKVKDYGENTGKMKCS